MDKLIIEGGHSLNGYLSSSGAKNSRANCLVPIIRAATRKVKILGEKEKIKKPRAI